MVDLRTLLYPTAVNAPAKAELSNVSSSASTVLQKYRLTQNGAGSLHVDSSGSATRTLVTAVEQLNVGLDECTPKMMRAGKMDVGVALHYCGPVNAGDIVDERDLVLDLAAILKTSPGRFKVASQQRLGGDSPPILLPNTRAVSLVRRRMEGSSAPGIGVTLVQNEVSLQFRVEKLHAGCPAAESFQVQTNRASDFRIHCFQSLAAFNWLR